MSEVAPSAPQQLPLAITLQDSAQFSNFFPGPNEFALSAARASAEGVGEHFVYLWGRAGNGRSHLLQAACHAAQEASRQFIYCPLSEAKQLTPDYLLAMEQLDLICIDDIDKVAGDPAWEEALFHLFNRSRERGCHWLVSASVMPQAAGFKLADLCSRLTSGLSQQMKPLSDQEKLAALQMRARLRGLTLSDATGEYLLTHGERSMTHLFACLDKLDKAALAAKRRLTIPFVKMVLLGKNF